MNTLDACINELTTYLRPPLATPEALARVAARGQLAPADLAACYLECRLSPPAPGIDLLIGTTRSQVKSRLPVASPPRGETRDPQREFVDRWLAGTLGRDVPFIWVELDDAAGTSTPRFTNLHVCVDPGYAQAAPGLQPSTPTSFDAERALTLLQDLQTASVFSQRDRETMDRCVAALPKNGRLVHVSAMAARAPAEVKAYAALPPDSLEEYVARVAGSAWCERLAALEPWLGTELSGSTLYADVTFRGNNCESVGLVFSQPQIAEVRDDASRCLIRARLMQEGLCTLAQDAALLEWARPPVDAVCSYDPSRRLLRWLDFKVTLTRARPISKAYLGFAPRISLF